MKPIVVTGAVRTASSAALAVAFLAFTNNVEIIQQRSRGGPLSIGTETPMDQCLYVASKGHHKDKGKTMWGKYIQSNL